MGDRAWPSAIAVLCLLLASVLIAYRDTGLAMVAIWSRSDTFAHAFLVPPIAGWLVWRKRGELAACWPRPTAWMLLPIGVASGAWLIGDLAAANAIAQLAFTALLIFVVVAVLGRRVSRVIAFPLGFLFFSVPIGEFVMPQMMQWTADFTVMALRVTGIPVYREGLQFVVPSGNWSVAEACSGIRYLIASIMVGTLFAYLSYRTLWRRLIFVGISAVVPIVANWVRAYLIVLIGDLSGNAAAVSADHLIYGWVFFGIVITLMFIIGSRWTEKASAAAVPARTTVADGRHPSLRGAMALLPVALGALVLFALPHLALRGMREAERSGVPNLSAPLSLADGWQLQPGGESSWGPAFKGTAAEFNRTYAKGPDKVGLYVGYYRHQDYDRKLVSSENQVVTQHEPDWSLLGGGSRTVSINGMPHEFRTTLLRASGHVAQESSGRLQVWKIFWVNGTLTADDTWATLCIAFQKLLGRGDDAAVIMVYRHGVDGDSGDRLLASFVESNLGTLMQALARARDPQALARTRDAETLALAVRSPGHTAP